MIRDGHLYVIICLVIATKPHLLNGQCYYHCVRGWCPYYKTNVKVAGVVTTARKIDDLWYSALMNGSTEIYKFKLSRAGLVRVPYDRHCCVDGATAEVEFFQSQEFVNNRMMRLLSPSTKVVVSWLCDKEVKYEPWESEFC